MAGAAADQFGDFTYTDTGTTITITDYPEAATGAVVIPATIAGKPVTAIGAGAFSSCGDITSVSIPPGVTSIGQEAFVVCAKLASVNIPEGVTDLGYNTFAGCQALSGVVLPSTLTSLGDHAFAICMGLTSIVIPPSVTDFGPSVFYQCSNLASIRLSPNAPSVGTFAFFSCGSLTAVTIPAGVTNIANSAFQNCASLTDVTFKGNAPSLGTNAFLNTASGLTMKFYNGKTGFTAPTWNGFTSANIGDEPFPEISIQQPAGSELADGGAGKNFGSVVLGTTSTTLEFRIENTGEEELMRLAITKGGSNPGDFTVSEPSELIVPSGESATFTVAFMPDALGSRTATLQIASDDADENPYDLVLTGTGIAVPKPEIEVMQPETSKLVDGKAKKSFGTVVIGKKGTPKSFTIKNAGKANLTGISVTLSGGNAGDFVVTKPGKTSLGEKDSTFFKVTFKPTAKGNRATTLKIKSNDADENPFDIKLSGMGAKK